MPESTSDSIAAVRKIKAGPNTKLGKLIAAAQLRAEGYSPVEISEKLSVSLPVAKAYLREAVRNMNSPELEDWRQLELMRLEKLHQSLWEKAIGDPANDVPPDLRHVDRILRIAERRSNLLGLDKPTEVVKATVSKEDGPRVLEMIPIKTANLAD
jgi:hypothetical protein